MDLKRRTRRLSRFVPGQSIINFYRYQGAILSCRDGHREISIEWVSWSGIVRGIKMSWSRAHLSLQVFTYTDNHEAEIPYITNTTSSCPTGNIIPIMFRAASGSFDHLPDNTCSSTVCLHVHYLSPPHVQFSWCVLHVNRAHAGFMNDLLMFYCKIYVVNKPCKRRLVYQLVDHHGYLWGQ